MKNHVGPKDPLGAPGMKNLLYKSLCFYVVFIVDHVLLEFCAGVRLNLWKFGLGIDPTHVHVKLTSPMLFHDRFTVYVTSCK